MDQKHRKWVACDVEEDYFSDSLKQSRKERKRLSTKDRSKFKKTDQNKQVARPSNENFPVGRVLSISSEGVLVELEGQAITCTLRGLLKRDRGLAKNLVTVGDFVRIESSSIVGVEPRKSVLSRADNLSRNKEQLIAANIDQVLIVASVVSPPIKPPLIDRYIIAAQKGNMTPVIIVNKMDLLQQSKEETEILEHIQEVYKKEGIAVYRASTLTGEGIHAIQEVMKDKASVFSGQSGTGKSSLINAITGSNFLVGETVKKTQKGAHTTSTAKLVPLKSGGWCIDTPGIKSFGIWNLELDELRHYFTDIQYYAASCKFPDCTHTHEEACAVQLQVEKGNISPLRYNSYLSLVETMQKEHRRR